MELIRKSFILVGLSMLTLNMCFAAQSPMTKYKLILNAEMGEETIKGKLFSEILRDMSSNQTRHVKRLKEWSDEKVLTHYGKLNPRGIKDKEKGNAELVRKKLIKKIEKRSKTLAKKVWSELQDKSLVQLKNNLKQTIELDKIHQKETAHKISKMEAKSKGNPGGAPSSPYYYPNYNGYYNYYGYNYLYDYGNYTNPYYYSYYSYYPSYYNNYYTYNPYRYNSYYYDYYYYPRYNRTVNLLASGLFGVAAVGSFVDWLFD